MTSLERAPEARMIDMMKGRWSQSQAISVWRNVSERLKRKGEDVD